MMALQSKFKKEIDEIIKNKRLSHAYLIETNGLIDYKENIDYFIKEILKSNKPAKAELELIFNQIDNNCFINLKRIETETVIKKEELLEIKRDYTKKSFLDYPEIYIIDDAAKLTPATANSILKFLEEPEEGIIAILITKNRYNVLDTIRSRTQILRLINDEKIELSGEEKETLDKAFTKEAIVNFDELLKLLPDKISANNIFSQIEKYYHQQLIDNYNEKYLQYVLIIEEEIQKLAYNVNYKLWLDAFLTRLMEVTND